MKTNLLKKYRKYFVLTLLFSLNICINFTSDGISIGMKQTYANQFNTGCTWLDDFLMMNMNYPGQYVLLNGVWTYCLEDVICNGSYGSNTVIAYQTTPSNSPVIPSTSDLWCLIPSSSTSQWSYWDYNGSGWQTVCDCCGHNPCTCTICRCCGENKCNCQCPKINFKSETYPINGSFVEYIWMEGWGISYGACYYNGYLSTSTNFYSCSAAMKITNPERNNDANFYGNIKYFEDNNEAGTSYLSPQGSSLYDSSYTSIGSCLGTITRKPCQIGEIEVNLGFSVCSFFVGINSFTVYNQKFQITTTQITEL